MSLQLQIEIKVPPGLRRGLQHVPAIAAAEMVRATEWSTQRVVQAAVPLTPVGATANLRGAHQTEIRGGHGAEIVRGRVFNTMPYALPVETGSAPHSPPANNLTLWVRRKLGKTGPELARTTHLIRRAIARRGTPAANMYRAAWRAVTPAIRGRYRQAVARIVQRMRTGT